MHIIIKINFEFMFFDFMWVSDLGCKVILLQIICRLI